MQDIIIIGGGILGLATALKIKQKNAKLSVLLLEKEDKLAQHQTGNNSGVIHSGVYYKPGSLKAKNCIDGYNQLLKFCDKEGVPYELCGKVIVATDKSELSTLSMIEERGAQNGLQNLKRLTKEEVKEHEPYVNGIAGIHVPQTGIIDYTAVSLKYAEIFQELGGEISIGQKVIDIQEKNGVTTIITNKDKFDTKLVVNCAGLYSDKIAKLTSEKLDLKIIPFRGEYFMIKPEKQYLIKNLVYPVPDPNFPFLGVHFTRMINGGIEAGPNAVLAFKREGYRKSMFNLVELGESLAWPGFQKVAAKYWKTGFGEMYRSFSKSAFTTALQKLLPDITENDLTPGGAGVRAQACDRNGGLIDDFLILEESNAINVCNAPSPAATSSLSIGDHVSDLAVKRF
ncbi:L-2-hydroxyglutarate oxidase [Marivirga sp.]|uniref:L-2-hydroxyglutarate oxidase n=1 Tax=Marivirga sp. TaxID=2018662 RepID=UPI0025EF8F61|nr:L-2-hydroxyglutarate oxidase [Marivirga sp.]